MKKLAIVLTLISSVAFAQTHMVRFDAEGGSVSTVDLSMSSKDNGTLEEKESNFAINYAYTVAPQWQVGLNFAKSTSDDGTAANNDGSTQTIGLDVYWNMEEDLMNTCYFGLHYGMTDYTDDNQDFADKDKTTTIGLEYGHRFALGKLWGATMTYAPNVTYTMATTALDIAGGKDVETTKLDWNFLKFDLLF